MAKVLAQGREDGLSYRVPNATGESKGSVTFQDHRMCLFVASKTANKLIQCDRGLPCGNCKSRGKESSCIYEAGAPTAKQTHQQQHSQQNTKLSPALSNSSVKQVEPSPPRRSGSPNNIPKEPNEPLSSKVADWGYAHNGASTMGILKRIESITDGEAVTSRMPEESSRGSPGKELALREKYKAIIRQLPARNYIEKLIEMYMHGFNWQYYPIDPDILYAQLETWNSLPFSVLSDVGPRGLESELRAFPALLFQVVATALLLLPEQPDSTFDSLKFAGDMRFEDLAVEYSESGQALLDLLGKSQLSLTTVQAQFLRASFQKFTAKVTDAVCNSFAAISNR